MRIAAIDPGKRGAFVVVNTETTAAYAEKLTYDDDGLMTTRIGKRFRMVDYILCEKIRGRGGWGANSTFAMGYYFGQVVHEIVHSQRPFEFVLPEAWTGIIHRDVDLIKGDNGAKAKSLRAYHMYFPHDPVGQSKGKTGMAKGGYHDGIIDALLIATHVLLKDNEEIPEWTFSEDLELV